MIHSTTRNAPYIHPSHDSILELWRTIPNGTTSAMGMIIAFAIVKTVVQLLFCMTLVLCLRLTWADPEGPPEKKIGFLNNTGPDPLKNHKAAKPAFDFGP